MAYLQACLLPHCNYLLRALFQTAETSGLLISWLWHNLEQKNWFVLMPLHQIQQPKTLYKRNQGKKSADNEEKDSGNVAAVNFFFYSEKKRAKCSKNKVVINYYCFNY